MTNLHIYSNRHIKSQVYNIKKDDWIFLENKMSHKRWLLFFRFSNIDEKSLNIKYITQEEFFNMSEIQFDNIVGNPPYQKNNQGLWQIFAIQAIKLLKPGGTLSFVTPTSWANGSNLGTERNIFNSVFQKYSCTEIHTDVNNEFKKEGHKIGKNISAWTVVKEEYSGKTKIFDENGNFRYIDISKYPFFINEFSFEALEIFEKIIDYGIFYREFVEKVADSDKYFAFPKAKHISYDSFGYRYNNVENNFPSSKITVGIDCSNKTLNQVKSIHSQFESSVFKFLWKIYGANDAGSFGWILRNMPKLPDNKIYTNQDVYEILDLKKYANLIEQNVK